MGLQVLLRVSIFFGSGYAGLGVNVCIRRKVIRGLEKKDFMPI
jgi:hypothetical protein